MLIDEFPVVHSKDEESCWPFLTLCLEVCRICSVSHIVSELYYN